MGTRKTSRWIDWAHLAVVALAVSAACSGPAGRDRPADLVPVSTRTDLASLGFCDTADNVMLSVTVANTGEIAAEATLVIVFEPPEIRAARMGSIGAGLSGTATLQMPPGCFNPDCDFEIFVDPLGDVAESDEGNNHTTGRCIGP